VTNEILIGFGAHVLGGLIGGVVGWLSHTVFNHLQRKKQHARFNREIIELTERLKGTIPNAEIPKVMERVVPLASRATFGVPEPPLNEVILMPSGAKLDCNICVRTIEPNFEGRCPTCKLGSMSYHVPAHKL
jgi:hypothetical protein